MKNKRIGVKNMIYHFTYQMNNQTLTKKCITLREAEIFFDILVSARVEYICVKTFKKFGGKYE